MICFLGDSYAALTLKEAARCRGLPLTDDMAKADLVFVSQDTPTDADGKRDLQPIRDMIASVPLGPTLVITSQVPPGFCRSLKMTIWYQAETLRTTGDGAHRAMHPEMFIIGCGNKAFLPSPAYQEYLDAFDCPVIRGSYEDAEFAKIAINMTLAAQVERTNVLSEAATKCGADWGRVSRALRHDSRIGKYAYLTPGDWTKSPHLIRDHVTLMEIQDDGFEHITAQYLVNSALRILEGK